MYPGTLFRGMCRLGTEFYVPRNSVPRYLPPRNGVLCTPELCSGVCAASERSFMYPGTLFRGMCRLGTEFYVPRNSVPGYVPPRNGVLCTPELCSGASTSPEQSSWVHRTPFRGIRRPGTEFRGTYRPGTEFRGTLTEFRGAIRPLPILPRRNLLRLHRIIQNIRQNRIKFPLSDHVIITFRFPKGIPGVA